MNTKIILVLVAILIVMVSTQHSSCSITCYVNPGNKCSITCPTGKSSYCYCDGSQVMCICQDAYSKLNVQICSLNSSSCTNNQIHKYINRGRIIKNEKNTHICRYTMPLNIKHSLSECSVVCQMGEASYCDCFYEQPICICIIMTNKNNLIA